MSGVHRTIGEYYKGKPRYYWKAMWSPAKGKRRSKSFSVLKFGEDEAKRLAIEARRQAIESLDAEWPEGSWPTSRLEDDQSDGVLKQDVFAYEGDEKFAIHKSKERDRTLRQAKLRAFLAKHGDLFCEICSFSFEEQYGALGRGLIEVHHLLPVAEMTQTHKTTLEELMCVCSNCHFALHNGDPQRNLEALRFIFEARRHKKSKNEPGVGADSR
jgi:predicted HNH restriction endonuclease